MSQLISALLIAFGIIFDFHGPKGPKLTSLPTKFIYV